MPLGRQGEPLRIMRNPSSLERAVTVLLAGALLLVAERGVAAVAPPQSGGRALLDVPLVSQAPCRPSVEPGVDQGLVGDREGSERGLLAATSFCLNDPASWRALVALRFSQSRWSEAQNPPLSAVRVAADDAYAWRLLATTRYLMGDLMGALDAWNHMGEPRLDTTGIHGADRTKEAVVVRAAGLQPGQELTPGAFGRALRRLHDLPIASNARMRYEPIDGGLARLDVFIDERKVVQRGWLAIGTIAARALLNSELRVTVAGPMGAGELETASWRWAAGRPRVAVGLALPSPHWFPGVVLLDASWERQSYDATPSSRDATLMREERVRAGLHVADWATSWLRWQTGAALDRLRDDGDLDQTRVGPRDYLAVESTLDARLAGDRLALAASAGWWGPFAGGDQFGTGGLLAAWRSTADATVPSWSAVSEIAIASRAAPLALWLGAGSGHGRSALLRAHPLHKGGVLIGPAFGRGLVHGSVEYVRPVVRTPTGGLSIAGFVDAAKAWHRLDGLNTSPLFVDAGVGLRVHTPGRDGAIRIDLAHGLRGGGTTLSAGWGGAWPR